MTLPGRVEPEFGECINCGCLLNENNALEDKDGNAICCDCFERIGNEDGNDDR